MFLAVSDSYTNLLYCKGELVLKFHFLAVRYVNWAFVSMVYITVYLCDLFPSPIIGGVQILVAHLVYDLT